MICSLRSSNFLFIISGKLKQSMPFISIYHRKTLYTPPISYLWSLLYPLKTSENLWFCDIFRRYRKRLVVCNKCLDTYKIFLMEEKAGWSSIFMKTTYVIIIEISQMMCSLNYLDFICLYSIFSVIGKREEIFGPFWICWTKIDITDLHHPENCYLFKVNNRNIRKVYEICSKFITSFWCHNC